MAFAIIIALYASVGVIAAVGSVVIVRQLFPARYEQPVFALFLIPIAAFYLAFTAYFGDSGAWGYETTAVIAFSIMGLLGIVYTPALVLGYLLHGAWDLLHELHAHAGTDLLGVAQGTQIPLAYGAFCATFDWAMAAWFAAGRQRLARPA